MKKRYLQFCMMVFWLLLLPGSISYAEEETEAQEETYGINHSLSFYFQWDPRWGTIPYGTGVIGNTGCGPTCMAMVAQYLTDNMDYTPEYIADYAANLGYYVPGKGTAWALFTDGCSGLDVSGWQISLDQEVFKAELLAGHPIILSMAQGDFTNDGHFIVVRGFDEEGFLINDPNSPTKTLETWDGYTLISQAAGGWAFEGTDKAQIRFDLLPGLDEELMKALMEEQ